MNVGDTVVFTGTVKDIVHSKDGPATTSVLTGSANLDNPVASSGKEYWFQDVDLKGVPGSTELEAMATAAGYKLEKIPPPATTPAPHQPAATHPSSTHK